MRGERPTSGFRGRGKGYRVRADLRWTPRARTATTTDAVAEEFGISEATVRRAGTFAARLDLPGDPNRPRPKDPVAFASRLAQTNGVGIRSRIASACVFFRDLLERRFRVRREQLACSLLVQRELDNRRFPLSIIFALRAGVFEVCQIYSSDACVNGMGRKLPHPIAHRLDGTFFERRTFR